MNKLTNSSPSAAVSALGEKGYVAPPAPAPRAATRVHQPAYGPQQTLHARPGEYTLSREQVPVEIVLQFTEDVILACERHGSHFVRHLILNISHGRTERLTELRDQEARHVASELHRRVGR